MKTNVLTTKGNKKKNKIELPDVFKTPYRPDVIKKAVLSIQTNRRQNYGANKRAGKRTSADYHGMRHLPPSQRMMNTERSRMPRHHGDTPAHMFMQGAFVPHAVGGRRAHPPKSEKSMIKNINKKEKDLALRSAISSTKDVDELQKRGHKYDGDLPLVVENSIEKIEKTQELREVLEELGLEEELERCEKKKIRSGRGKGRGRKYKKKVGPLIIVDEDRGVVNAASNLSGVEVKTLNELNVEDLSPGSHGIRLCVWTDGTIKKLKERFN
ncbi:MAG: 50S ribosomal protein L4 [Candidatus Aenigmatarchaeota archaeon]